MKDFDFSHLTDEQDRLVALFENLGEATAEANRHSDLMAANQTIAMAWLAKKKKERELQEWQASMDASEASRINAAVATKSLDATKFAARATAFAAAFTAVAAIATGMQAYLQYDSSKVRASDGIVQSQLQGHSIPDHHGAPPRRLDVGTARAR